MADQRRGIVGALFGPPQLRPFRPGEVRPNSDGSYSTEISMTSPDPSGQWMNYPSLWMGADNKPVQFMDEDAAQNQALNYEKFGYQFPRFRTLSEAEKVAEARSKAGGAGIEALAKALIGGGQVTCQPRACK